MTIATMFVRHTVSDFGKWKSVYDGLEPWRKKMGTTAASVHRDASDPNSITVLHQFKNLDAAMAFAHSEELKSAMAKGGVSRHPEIWFTEDVEHTPH